MLGKGRAPPTARPGVTVQWLSPCATKLTCRRPRVPGRAASPPPVPAPAGACWPQCLSMWPGRSASESGAAFPGDAESCSGPGQVQRQQRDTQHRGLEHSMPTQDPTSSMGAPRHSQQGPTGRPVPSGQHPPLSPYLPEALLQGLGRPVLQQLLQDVLHSACVVLGVGPGAPHTHTSLTHAQACPLWEAFLPWPTQSPIDPNTELWMPYGYTRPRMPGPHLSQHRYSWDLRSSLELCTWKPSRASCRSPGQPA